jgi:ribosomal protein S12 methylthiotransferase accessory factor
VSEPIQGGLATALSESRLCGVTRLASVTGLDCLGVPVFQAIRPWGRSLSVHQGKGLDDASAMIGALMEAIESDRAESFTGDQRRCAFDQLAPDERAPILGDFARDGDAELSEAEPMAWVAARDPRTCRPLWVPFDVVSVDYSRVGDLRLDRSSNGLGARFDEEGASLKALLEVIERDAGQTWRATSLSSRSLDQVRNGSITLDWFEDLHARATANGLIFSIYRIAAVVPLPVFVCEIFEPRAGAVPRRRAAGVGCGFLAEEALLAAVLEAAQSRLTAISGARDDLAPPNPMERLGFGFAFPPDGREPLKDLAEVVEAFAPPPPRSVAGIAEALARAGYPRIGLMDVSPPAAAVRVVKAVAPGLGGLHRARRPPIVASRR